MKYGLSDKQLQEITAILASYEQVEEAVLFGSRAIDTYKEASDVDIVVKGDQADWSLAATLKSRLEEDTYLPFFFDVLAYNDIRSEALKKHIDTKGKRLYSKRMSGWRECIISDVADIIGGGTPKTSNKEFWNGDIAWITPKDLTNYHQIYISKGKRNITIKGLQNSSARLLPKESVLLTSRAPIGYVAISSNELCTNQGFKSIIPIKDKTNSMFLYYWVKNNVAYLQSNGTGTTFSEITGTTIKQLKILLPPLPEQRAIAEVLSSLDDKIDWLHRQNRTLEQMAETLFRQWFVEEGREEWGEKSLSSIATFLNGLACQKYPPKNDVKKLPVLKINELRNGFSKDCSWCTSDVQPEYLVKNGDVIFSWSASLMIKIWDGKNCILNQHLFKVTSEQFPKWYYYLWSKYHLDQFIAIAQAHATTMGHIKRVDLNEALVFVPSLEELKEMNKTFEPIIEKIIANNNRLNSLVNLRDTLLPKLMSGDIAVKSV